MPTLLRGLVFFGVIFHLALVLAESSYFSDVFAFLGHTGLLIIHIIVLTFVSVIAIFTTRTPSQEQRFRKENLGRSWWVLAVVLFSYAAWAFFCTLPNVGTIDRMCELVLMPLTMASLFLCAPLILERRHYRMIFLGFAALLALHSLVMVWIMLSNDPTFLGRTVITNDGHPKFFGPFRLPQTNGFFSNANWIGSFLALFPGYLLSEFLVARRQFKAPLMVTGLLIGLGLILSFCRAAEAAVLVGLVFPVIAFVKKPGKRWLLCAAILLATIVASAPDHYQWEHMQRSIAEISAENAAGNTTGITAGNTDGNSAGNSNGLGKSRQLLASVAHTVTTRRTEIWLAFFRDWQLHPFRGYGLLGIDYRALGPHNFLLANLVYFGIPGVVLLVTLLVMAARQIVGRLRAKDHPEVLVPIAGALAALAIVHGSMEYTITYPEYFTNSMFWLLLGYACFTKLGQTLGIHDGEAEDEGNVVEQSIATKVDDGILKNDRSAVCR